MDYANAAAPRGAASSGAPVRPDISTPHAQHQRPPPAWQQPGGHQSYTVSYHPAQQQQPQSYPVTAYQDQFPPLSHGPQHQQQQQQQRSMSKTFGASYVAGAPQQHQQQAATVRPAMSQSFNGAGAYAPPVGFDMAAVPFDPDMEFIPDASYDTGYDFDPSQAGTLFFCLLLFHTFFSSFFLSSTRRCAPFRCFESHLSI